MRRIAESAPFLAIALLIALSALAPIAERARAQLWQGYAGYASPFLNEWPTGTARPPLSQRVVVVLVHGLRLVESRQMPTLNAWRQRGADVTIEAKPPTYRLPATFTWLSGAWPETHGVTTNDAPPPSRPDTLLRAIQSSGWAVAFIGSDRLYDELGIAAQRVELVDDLEPAQRDQQAVELVRELLRDPAGQAQFVLVEISLLEEVARSDPDSYSAAVAATDFRLQAIGEALNLGADTLVVLSDRGLTRDGRDGGGEAEVARTPLVMAGAGILAGTQAVAPATSIAPTLAALAGAPIPIHAQGGPIFAVLAPESSLPLASARQLTAFYEQWISTLGQPRFAAELLRRYEDRMAAGDEVAYATWLAELNRSVAAAAGARLTAERAARLPFTLGVCLLLLIIAGLLLNARVAAPLIGALAYLGAWLVLFFAVRQSMLSLSLFPDSDPMPTFAEWERLSAMLMLAVCAIVALTTARQESVFDAVATVLSALGLVVVVQLIAFMVFYWQWGDAFTWTLPDSPMLVAALLALTQVAALTVPVAPALPDLPVALLAAIAGALIYAAVRRPA
jgi:hypothetical protein